MKPVISLSDVCKRFKTRRKAQGGLGAHLKSALFPQLQEMLAVDGVSFELSRGERVAFIGPNGAGKSTTLKILSGILCPDSGRTEVLGLSPFDDRKRLGFRIGTVFGQRSQLWYQLPPATPSSCSRTSMSYRVVSIASVSRR